MDAPYDFWLVIRIDSVYTTVSGDRIVGGMPQFRHVKGEFEKWYPDMANHIEDILACYRAINGSGMDELLVTKALLEECQRGVPEE